MKKEKKRNISLEILRILCMLMIVTLHFFSYSNIGEVIQRYSLAFWIKEFITSISGVCVNCFVLISGYFCLQTTFKMKKVVSLMFEVVSYSLAIYIILVVTNQIVFDWKILLFSVLPTLTRQYWFMTTYIGTYLISPLLRKLGTELTKKQYTMLLLIGFLLFVVYYNLFFFCDTLNFGGATGIVWFSYLYLCGMFFKRFNFKNNNLKNNLKRYIILVVLNIGSRIPFYFLNIVTKKEIFFVGATIFGSVYNSIFVFIGSILFFNIFINLNISFGKNITKVISILSSASLAVYLVHDNNNVRKVLWKYLNYSMIDSSIKLIVAWLATILIIYILCAGIELLRKKIEILIDDKTGIFEKIAYTCSNCIGKLERFIEERFV